MGIRKETIRSKKVAPPISTYSQAVKAGDFVFVSAGPSDAHGKVVNGDVREATRMTIENAKAILEEAGSSLEDVVHVMVLLRDFGNYRDFEAVYSEYFGKSPPTRVIMQPARTPFDRPIGMHLIGIVKKTL